MRTVLERGQSASDLICESLAILRALPDAGCETAFPLYQLSELARGDGNFPEAERLCLESLDLYRHDEQDFCGVWRDPSINSESWQVCRGDFCSKRRELQQALDLYRESGDAYGIANVLNDLGIVLDGMGMGEKAWQL